MAQITRVAKNQHQKEIIKLFDGLQGSHNMWQLAENDSIPATEPATAPSVQESEQEKIEYIANESGQLMLF